MHRIHIRQPDVYIDYIYFHAFSEGRYDSRLFSQLPLHFCLWPTRRTTGEFLSAWSGDLLTHNIFTSMSGQARLLSLQGVVIYMLPVEVFVTTIKFFWLAESLIAWLSPSEALNCLIFKGQRTNCSHASWLLIFTSLEVTLIPWSAPKKSFDHIWFKFWSRSQTLLRGTYKWLPLGLLSMHTHPYSILLYSTAFHVQDNPLVHTTNKHKAMVAKMAQDVAGP